MLNTARGLVWPDAGSDLWEQAVSLSGTHGLWLGSRMFTSYR
jgi:hypothetical protein